MLYLIYWAIIACKWTAVSVYIFKQAEMKVNYPPTLVRHTPALSPALCNPRLECLLRKHLFHCCAPQQHHQVICFNLTRDGYNSRRVVFFPVLSISPQNSCQLEEALHNFCHHHLPQPQISCGLLGVWCSAQLYSSSSSSRVGTGSYWWYCYNGCGATLHLSCHACNKQQISVWRSSSVGVWESEREKWRVSWSATRHTQYLTGKPLSDHCGLRCHYPHRPQQSIAFIPWNVTTKTTC